MSDLHFVLEHPQDNNRREHKKRPRLVTSCDNCRAKKLKCIKGGENAPCESCSNSGVICEFRDREQYFAERSAKSVNAAGGSSGSQRLQLSPRARNSIPDYAPGHPNHRGSDALKRPGSSRSHKSTKSQQSPPPVLGQCSSPVYDSGSPVPDDASPPLFDPNRWQRPNPMLMVSFIDIFFRTGGGQFGFLVYDELVRRVYDDDLDYVLANCIAAWATRYEKIPVLGKLDKMSVSAQYVSRAKALFYSLPPGPNLSILHSLIVLAWLQSSHLDEFYAFAQAANRMSSDLNITAAIGMSSGDPSHRQVLQQTWSCVNQLVAAVSGTQSNLGNGADATHS